MQLLQKIVQIAFEPCRRVICLLRGDLYPRLRLHVLLALTVLIHGELVQLIRLNDL